MPRKGTARETASRTGAATPEGRGEKTRPEGGGRGHRIRKLSEWSWASSYFRYLVSLNSAVLHELERTHSFKRAATSSLPVGGTQA